MTGRHRLVAVAALASRLALAPALLAQTTGSVEVGASAVKYETFLGSAAAYLTPRVLVEAPSLALGVQGDYILFESGNRILHGSLAGGWLGRAGDRVGVELSGSAGLATYADAPGYGHALARGRLHLIGNRSGAWLGAATGQSFLGAQTDAAHEVTVGLWSVPLDWRLDATASGVWIADLAYVDVVGSAHWVGDFFEVDGTATARAWATGVERGVYGQLTLRVPLSRRVAVSVSGGSYPADPVRGGLAASYASIGLRLATAPRRRALSAHMRDVLARVFGAAPRTADAGAVRLALEAAAGDQRTLTVDAPGARSVEIMADFTDWQPVRLARRDDAAFAVTLTLTPGVHRLNVRIDGGPWIVPAGLRAEQGEFGGSVGVLLIPER